MTEKVEKPGIPEDEFLREGYIDRLAQYVAAEPGAWHLRYNLAVALIHHGRLDEALEHFDLVLLETPKHMESLVNIGGIHLSRGQADLAMKAFTKALSVWDTPLVRANLAVAYMQLGQTQEAVKQLERALAQDSRMPDAWTNLGSALLQLDRLEESAAASRKALELRSDFAMAHNNLGLALLALEQVDQAKEHITEAIKLGYPVHPQLIAQLELGQA
jgi:tetratricopeptide (TPR) repeat protein